ncbi:MULTISPECIES: TonB-dependent receptor [unclassified Roseateles]|uniref:TonB-dependent receptor n=1 Tax=unclassified Roseateles TaxID=2626991 RepID=UPI00070072BC|nr:MULTISPECIES: TonB-dependent receptor [unclassified Roseateles]KQW45340.1 TonB-dependent receptor [Pelomonas sp. Root405]KRA72184.1 TonB-dependent receptor [Pelomonas sp. Root662]
MNKPALAPRHARADSQRFALSLTAAAALAALSTTALAQEAAKGEALETVVVTGVRASLTKSLANKRTNDQVVESVVAEDIGKLPDNNVVEALQRVTGIQVTNRAGGEVGAISIRGLPDVATTWNGRNIFTASGTQVALQDIPSTLVRQIDVYKTRDAGQLENGIAGQIDVKSLRPFDFKGSKFSLLARETYLDPAKKWNPQLSGMASNRWKTDAGEFGALVNLSMVKTDYRNESVTPGAMVPFTSPNAAEVPAGYTPLQRIFDNNVWTPGTYTGLPQKAGSTLNFGGTQHPYYLARDAVFQSDVEGQRERPAANLALQWQPNEDAVYTFEAMYNGYRDKAFNKLLFSFVDWWGSLGPNPASTITTFPGTNVIKTRTVNDVYGFNSGDYLTSATDSYVYALNGKWNLGDRLRLDGDVSYQTSKFHSEFTATRLDRVAPSITVDFNSGGGNTAFKFNNNAELVDPAKWNVAQFYDNANRNEGSAATASLNGAYDAEWGPLKTLHFGVRFDSRKASEANRTQSGFLGKNLATLGANYYHVNSNFGTDISDVPRAWIEPNAYYIRDNLDQWRQMYSAADPNFQTTDKLSLQKTFQVKEDTTNLFLMADSEHRVFGRPLRANFGVRYVQVNTGMTAYEVNATTKVVTPKSAEKTARKFLPSLTLRYEPVKDVLVRLNYGETLRRPGFGDLNPVLQLSDDVSRVGYGGGSGGNPGLEPTRSKNLDLTGEWYFQKDSALYGTVFQRKIEGLVVPLRRRIRVGPADDPFRNSTSGGDHSNGYDYVISSPVNASDGEISGVELGAIYFPKGLPGLLDGLGFQGSVTRLTSSQNVPTANNAGQIVSQLESPFFGVSKLSWNATLAYEKGPVGARLSYVKRSSFLAANEAALFANPIGIWRQPEKSVDVQLTYNLNDRMAFDISGVNLTNEMQQQYYKFGDAGSPELTNFGTVQIGRSVSVGFRWKL